ncbi:uncharacterized protein LOC108683084 isoform X2 [Hyalella azteca]|uniref:Uncharacterized protein LOC108683084 isoform X2 n=1 Tax=Hyalella azteca TaxID=294128 RepID=A0A979FQT2_HYAAZ|nr:uncharacterized protein LOC108683084 isoform X2 [Hyalella azteca]
MRTSLPDQAHDQEDVPDSDITMPFFRFGKKSAYTGLRLWDIILRLPRLGVGRIVQQNHLKVFSEPSLIKLMEVDANMDEYREVRGKVLGERWYRGHYCGVEDITSIANLNNYSLVMKMDEEKLMEDLKTCKKPDPILLPSTAAFPPVFKMFLKQQHDITADRYPLEVPSDLPNNFYVRVAEDGGQPTVPFAEVDGLGTTRQPHLYVDLPLDRATVPPPKDSISIPTLERPRRIERMSKLLAG